MSALFLTILHMSVCASWLVLAVLLLRLCLRRAPKWFNVLLWGIVAVRLVFPFSVESPLSLLPRSEAIRPAITTVQTQPAQISSAAAAGGSAAPAQSWLSILAWVWLAGAAALLLYTMVSTLRLRHRVREAVRLRGNIYQSERIDSPFVLGTIRPRIYLPYRMDSRDRQHVIAHEQAHLRRGDHLWKPLGFLLLTLLGGWPGTLLGSACIGFANGVGIPFLISEASMQAGKSAASTVMPLLSAAMYLAQFLSPLLLGALRGVLGDLSHLAYWFAVVLAILFVLCSLRIPVGRGARRA